MVLRLSLEHVVEEALPAAGDLERDARRCALAFDALAHGVIDAIAAPRARPMATSRKVTLETTSCPSLKL